MSGCARLYNKLMRNNGIFCMGKGEVGIHGSIEVIKTGQFSAHEEY